MSVDLMSGQIRSDKVILYYKLQAPKYNHIETLDIPPNLVRVCNLRTFNCGAREAGSGYDLGLGYHNTWLSPCCTGRREVQLATVFTSHTLFSASLCQK